MPKKPSSKKPSKKTSKKAPSKPGLAVVPEVSELEDARKKKATKKQPKSAIILEMEQTIAAMMDSMKEQIGTWKPVSGTIPFGLMLSAELDVDPLHGETLTEDGATRIPVVPPCSLNVVGLSVLCEQGQYRIKKITVLDQLFASNVDAATFRTRDHVGELYTMPLGLVNESRPIILEVEARIEDPGILSITFFGRPFTPSE